MCDVEQYLQHTYDMVAVEKSLFYQFQTQHMTNNSYAKSFNTHITVLKTYDRIVAQHPTLVTKKLISKNLSSPTPEEQVVAQLGARDEYLICLMLLCIKYAFLFEEKGTV